MTATLRALAEETLRLAAAATPGPWKTDLVLLPFEARRRNRVLAEADAHLIYEAESSMRVATNDGHDAAHIAHARTAAPALATALLKIMEAADGLREARAADVRSDMAATFLRISVDEMLRAIATLESP